MNVLASTLGRVPKTKVVNSCFTFIYARAVHSINSRVATGAGLTVGSAGEKIRVKEWGVNNKANLL